MHKLILLVLFMGCFAVAAQAQNFDSLESKTEEPKAAPAKASAACQDDPRLESELLTLLQSTEPITPPITVTPYTFINLDPEVLQALAGQMIICPNTPVLKSGKPARKVVADFEVIWDNVRKAAIAGDDARVKELLTNYKAAPKPTEEIITLLAPIGLDDKTRENLYKIAGLKLDKDENQSRLIDFYKVLGGRAADNVMVVILSSGHLNDSQREKLKEEYKKFLEIAASNYNLGYHPEILARILKGVGCRTDI